MDEMHILRHGKESCSTDFQSVSSRCLQHQSKVAGLHVCCVVGLPPRVRHNPLLGTRMGDFEVSKMGQRNPGHVDSRLGEQGSDDSKDKILVHSAVNMTLKWPANAKGYVRISNSDKPRKEKGVADLLSFYIDKISKETKQTCLPGMCMFCVIAWTMCRESMLDAVGGVTECEFQVPKFDGKARTLHIKIDDPAKKNDAGIGYISLY